MNMKNEREREKKSMIKEKRERQGTKKKEGQRAKI